MRQLDALRFFAVMGVIIVHNWQPSPGTSSWDSWTGQTWA
jgi:peptidoglycan/LPS O-acetylase OafA/YrhL